MYSIENKSEESRAIQNNSEKHEPIAQFKDNRSLSAVEEGKNTAQLEKKENLTGMPDDLKEGIESLSGFSMDDVRVHYNSSKPATVQALAYTQGTDIHVAPGQEKCLPHEAWHVAQQMAGRVSPTTNINGMPVNDNVELEHEADVMGEKAVGQRVEKKILTFNGKYAGHHKFLSMQCFINPNRKSVWRLLEKQSGFNKNKTIEKKIDSFLDEINDMQSSFDAENIAEILRINNYNIKQAYECLTAYMGEKLDERMGEGHIGAQHYAKSEYFQKKRMLKEHRDEVTSLVDSTKTKKFFIHVKNTVKDNLIIVLNDCIETLSNEANFLTSIRNIKQVLSIYENKLFPFQMYSIKIASIHVRGSVPGSFEVTFELELESAEDYEKIQYSMQSKSSLSDKIRMYWGHNNPSVVVNTRTEYSDLYDFLVHNVKEPVTGY